MDDPTRRHAMWIARSMARTERSPLTGADIVALEEACEPVRVDSGTILLPAGSEAKEVYIVREGMVHLAVRNPTLGRQTIGLVPPGGIVGDVSVLLGRPMPYDALADSDCTLLRLDRSRLPSLLSSSPSMALRWTTSLAMRVEAEQSRVVTLLTKDLSAQVATLLIDHRVEEGSAWMVRMPHQTIADLLGARRQSVSRVLGQMRRDDLVRSRYGAVEILDLDGVAAIAGRSIEDPDLAQPG